MFRGDFWRRFDFWLFGAVILALAFGVAMIRSSVAGNEELINHPQRQMTYGGIGLAVVFVVTLIDYRFWAALNRPMYIVMMLLLIILFLGAQAIFGAARWFQVGTILIQPTELAKIVLILILANYFSKHEFDPRTVRWMLGSLALTFGLAIWILLQPNLSNVIVLMVIWIAMLWINGVQVKHMLIMAGIGLVVIVAGFPFLQEYQQLRVINFLFPDPGARHGATYNVLQALIAIGSGGLLGEGYGLGSQTQLRFMKVRHTDFIFSVTAEEFGFLGAVFLTLLLIVIILRCLRASRLARDTYGSLIAYGVAVVIFFQTAVNIAVNLNLIPVTGLPLPFISYGGSGLLSMMLGVGLVESVVLRHKPLEF